MTAAASVRPPRCSLGPARPPARPPRQRLNSPALEKAARKLAAFFPLKNLENCHSDRAKLTERDLGWFAVPDPVTLIVPCPNSKTGKNSFSREIGRASCRER